METFCKACNKPTKYRPPQYLGKYCNNTCQHDWTWEHVTKQKIREGLLTTSNSNSTLRRFLTERDGEQCSECGLTDWRGNPITLDIDHIDGDNRNNLPENLRYLCPNCHRQTPTWGNKRR